MWLSESCRYIREGNLSVRIPANDGGTASADGLGSVHDQS
jgi:hypothetical protein